MLELECGSCNYLGDMPETGEDGGYVEFTCPLCGDSTYERIED